MKNRWNDKDATPFLENPKRLRIYTSRLLGQEPELVLHGGGNTSVKLTATDFFGNDVDILFVKGSGWDLATIEEAGFAPERLDTLKQLAKIPTLSDSDMVEQQRIALLDSKAPNASVEAILHAIIPFRFVDHTHANAALAIMNTPDGETRIREIYGERIIVIPYVMPGFSLARLVYEQTQGIDWTQYEGMFLMNHGVFTFSDDGRESYERMIQLINEAEGYIQKQKAVHFATGEGENDPLSLASLRQRVSLIRGVPVIAHCDRGLDAVGYASLPDLADYGVLGPLTPDHSIFAKRIPALLGKNPLEDIDAYAHDYQAYFARNATQGLSILDQAPRWALWPNHGIVSFGLNLKNATVIGDIAINTARVVQMAQQLGGWSPLSESEIFEVEYWELEQAKLKSAQAKPTLQGKIAVTLDGSAESCRACVEELLRADAAVAAISNRPPSESAIDHTAYRAFPGSLNDPRFTQSAIDGAVNDFGGIDVGILFLDASIEEYGSLLEQIAPYLQLGIEPALVLVSSQAFPSGEQSGTDLALSFCRKKLGPTVRLSIIFSEPSDGPLFASYYDPSATDSTLSPSQSAQIACSLAKKPF